MPVWETLSADERRLYARMMEVFAGFVEHADHHIGRLIAFLKEIGDQFCHAIDLVPTVLDALGIEPPASIRGVTQAPLAGRSLVSAFDDAGGWELYNLREDFAETTNLAASERARLIAMIGMWYV